MDNDIDMNNMIKKAQEMIKNNQIPAEFKDIFGQFSSKSQNLNTKNTPNMNNNIRTNNISSKDISSNTDIYKISKLLNAYNNNINEDNMSKLLNALKPYLRNNKQEKIDEYIKLLKIGKIAQLFDSFGGDNK